MRIPVPAPLAMKISRDAVRHANESMAGFGWSDKAMQALSPMPGEGLVGIKTSAKYLMYQERGIKPFLMWWVQGRTIPMGCKAGDGPHFRRGGHVGEPGYVDIPHVGQVWRDQRWRHPGLAPKNFMRDSLHRAVEENRPLMQQWARNLFKAGAR